MAQPPSLADIIGSVVWESRPDYGPGAELAFDRRLSIALDWECPSCREDVGWAKWERLERHAGIVTLHIECGHCGSETSYDAVGDQLD